MYSKALIIKRKKGKKKGHLEPIGFSGFPSTHPCHLQLNLPYQLLSLGSSQKKINMIQRFCHLLPLLPWHFWPFGTNFMPPSLHSHSRYWQLSPGLLRPPVWPLRLGHSINRRMVAYESWSIEIWTTMCQKWIFVGTMFSLFLMETAYVFSVT